MTRDVVEKNRQVYLRAHAALVALTGVDSNEARGLVGVLHRLLDQTDGWSFAALLAATERAEGLVEAAASTEPP